MTYESDDATFDDPAYRVRGWRGVAFYVLGWEVVPDEDTEWSGQSVRTGRVVVCMVGDDRKWSVGEDEIEPLRSSDYCGGCGQIGCKCYGTE
jgi:hypothetical protein